MSDTNVLQNECETTAYLSQSFCDDGTTKCGDARVRFDCPDGDCPEGGCPDGCDCDSSDDACPGGVCPLPKRKMRSPGEGDGLKIQGMDQLFSNLLGSMFQKGMPPGMPPKGRAGKDNILEKLLGELPVDEHSEAEDSDGEHSGEHSGDHSECGHSEFGHLVFVHS